jgi:hypothetical protein
MNGTPSFNTEASLSLPPWLYSSPAFCTLRGLAMDAGNKAQRVLQRWALANKSVYFKAHGELILLLS